MCVIHGGSDGSGKGSRVEGGKESGKNVATGDLWLQPDLMGSSDYSILRQGKRI
jgi:hypothetical protein